MYEDEYMPYSDLEKFDGGLIAWEDVITPTSFMQSWKIWCEDSNHVDTTEPSDSDLARLKSLFVQELDWQGEAMRIANKSAECEKKDKVSSTQTGHGEEEEDQPEFEKKESKLQHDDLNANDPMAKAEQSGYSEETAIDITDLDAVAASWADLSCSGDDNVEGPNNSSPDWDHFFKEEDRAANNLALEFWTNVKKLLTQIGPHVSEITFNLTATHWMNREAMELKEHVTCKLVHEVCPNLKLIRMDGQGTGLLPHDPQHPDGPPHVKVASSNVQTLILGNNADNFHWFYMFGGQAVENLTHLSMIERNFVTYFINNWYVLEKVTSLTISRIAIMKPDAADLTPCMKSFPKLQRLSLWESSSVTVRNLLWFLNETAKITKLSYLRLDQSIQATDETRPGASKTCDSIQTVRLNMEEAKGFRSLQMLRYFPNITLFMIETSFQTKPSKKEQIEADARKLPQDEATVTMIQVGKGK